MSKGPMTVGDVLMGKTPFVKGEWHATLSRSRASYLLEVDPAEYGRVLSEIDAVLDLLESPIEQIAIHQMMGRSYSSSRRFPLLANVYRTLPEKWPDGANLIFVPQVSVSRFRVDFMAYLGNGLSFAVECDGAEFHDPVKDGHRDSALIRHHKLPVLRFTGADIWYGPLWSEQVIKMVLMLDSHR